MFHDLAVAETGKGDTKVASTSYPLTSCSYSLMVKPILHLEPQLQRSLGNVVFDFPCFQLRR